MVRLIVSSVPNWPPLAWLACSEPRTGNVVLVHGSRVETAERWFCEAAWDGEYGHGDYSLTHPDQPDAASLRPLRRGVFPWALSRAKRRYATTGLVQRTYAGIKMWPPPLTLARWLSA
jgi:hypothetical protein